MATLIICPACETRYQIKAALPPEGRKVRCAKCGNVWQAHAAETGASAPETASKPEAAVKPSPAEPGLTPPEPPPQSAAPRSEPPVVPPPPAPATPPEVPSAREPQATPPGMPPGSATPPPVTPPSPAAVAPPPVATAPAAEPELPPPPPAASQPPPPLPGTPTGMPPGPQLDASFDAEAAFGADSPDAVPPTPEPAKSGGLFGKLMRKRHETAPPDIAPPPEMAPTHQVDAAFGGQPEAGLDATLPVEEQQDPALADPDLVAAALGESPPPGEPKKQLPIVAIGWGILALIVLVVLGLFFFAKSTTVSILPGAGQIYAKLGTPVGAQALKLEGVSYGWTNKPDGQSVLEVKGNVLNTSSDTVKVPALVIALRNENGDEISEFKAEVDASELAAGEQAPFVRQIQSPPSNVRSLEVRFAEAN